MSTKITSDTIEYAPFFSFKTYIGRFERTDICDICGATRRYWWDDSGQYWDKDQLAEVKASKYTNKKLHVCTKHKDSEIKKLIDKRQGKK